MAENETSSLQLQASPKKPRHSKWSKAEVAAAQGNLFEKMLIHRQQVQDLREGKKHKLIMISRSMLLCGLPYRPTAATEVTRCAKTGSGKTQVTYYAMGHDTQGNAIPMARGTDRNFLHWSVDRAIKLKNRFVPFDSAKEFFDDMEITPTGPNYQALRETQQRLSALLIMVEHFSRDGVLREKMDIFDASHLPRSIQPNIVPIDGPMGLRFSEKFFADFSLRPVPFLLPLLRTLRKKPQMQDYVLFLNHRCCASDTTSCVPWDALRTQLWQEDSNPRRMRWRMDDAIGCLRTAWPELNAVTTRGGLMIGPPLDDHRLIPTFLLKAN
jgi:hypothetical protein